MPLVITLVSIALFVVPVQKKVEEKDVLGTWTGTWTGGSSGTFEMTVTKGSDGKMAGSVSPKPDNGDPYTAPFTSVQLADGKLTIKLLDPSGGAEITLEATVEGTAFKGEYFVRGVSDGSEVERGTVAGKKKS